MKTVALIQARMGSNRLPGKVMKDLGGMPMIEFLLRRLSKSKLIDQIVVTTSIQPENDKLVSHVKSLGYEFFQGSENDVLDRFYKAAIKYEADIVIRITADCPLVDPMLVDHIVSVYKSTDNDYVTNTLPPTFPDGLDIEVFSIDALKRAHEEATTLSEREHVTPYIRHSVKFKIFNVSNDEDLSAKRWTVDEASDFQVIHKVVRFFYPDVDFGWRQVLELTGKRPEIFALNENIMRNEGYMHSKLAEIVLRSNTSFEKSKEFKYSIHDLIPGGAHTYSKGDDQFPELSPGAISYGKGAHVWDIDGNEYLDCSMGLTSVSLGHAYQPVIESVQEELVKGVNFQRPSILEKEMAEKFLSLIPQHDMIKFAKNGSIVTTAAVKLARAYTGRKLVAFPGDHPFYSYDDWFIGKTLCNKGVPEEFSELSVTFKSCDIESLKQLFQKYPGQIACVITEPEKSQCGNGCQCKQGPAAFLKEAIEVAHQHGALFIIDEMVSGFKTALPGTTTKYGLKPDMATWGKGIANGFSFCALTGTKEVMNIGGINRPGEEKVFLISTTHGGETHAMAAAIATINEFKSKNVIEHIHSLNKLLATLCTKLIKDSSLEEFVNVIACEWMPVFIFKNALGEICQGYRTLFMQEMISRGVLFQGIFASCYSHTEDDIYYFAKAFSESLETYAKAINEGYDKYLIGEPAKAVFRSVL